jgi:apolipoprotein N-acyltransferase
VESGRSVFRVSNGGISTSVDPVGRYRETVKAGEDRKGVEGVLRDRVPIAKGQTLWIRFGDGAIGGLLGLLLLLVPAFSYWLRKSRGL